jgi:hypothetical protein
MRRSFVRTAFAGAAGLEGGRPARITCNKPVADLKQAERNLHGSGSGMWRLRRERRRVATDPPVEREER